MTSSADDELAAWLRLLLTDAVGRQSARRLLAAFGSAQTIFDASTAARREVVGNEQANALARPPQKFDESVEALRSWLAASARRQVLTLADPQYPRRLLETADPPLLLFVQGRAELLDAPSIAIVGSRNPTAQGVDNAREFAAHLSRDGWTIVSGLASGIDSAAHEGALQGLGSTIAVVGTGLDRVYPRANHELATRITQTGAMLSEFALATPPLAANFPRRNRVIAGLTRGTLVVEAALQSGSLITARLAAEYGCEVFAIPGSIHSPQARGCHALIKQGAKLVETAQDILDEIGELQPAAASDVSVNRGAPPAVQGHGNRAHPEPDQPDKSADAVDPVLRVLGHDPATLDALLARTGMPTGELSARLLELELQGRVARLPGGLYQRRQVA